MAIILARGGRDRSSRSSLAVYLLQGTLVYKRPLLFTKKSFMCKLGWTQMLYKLEPVQSK